MTTLMQPMMTGERVAVVQGKKPTQTGKTGLVSVIVPCYGQLEYTRLCLPRVLRYSRAPFEVILIDAGALDGTPEYLAGVAAIPSVRVEIVQADPEVGLLAACAAGVERASGEYVVFLSNDTVVGERWLNHLVAAAKVAADIGMVGTMSNMTPPPQWVGKLPYRIGGKKRGDGAVGRIVNPSCHDGGRIDNPSYRHDGPLDLEAVDAFAREWREQNAGKSFEVERLGGSCLLLKAEVCKKIDWADASTPFGAIDGDLLSEKVRAAGYRLVCCRDLFLHHFGSRLFAALRIESVVRSQ
jgi:GT2 family glycosyltransferase